MLRNVICSSSDFLQVEHLDKLGQAQGNSEITHHNYLTLLCSTAFQLDLKRPKHSTHHTQLNSTNSTSNNNTKPLVVLVKAIVQVMVIVVMAMVTNLSTTPIASLFQQNFGNPSQHLLILLFHNIIINITIILPMNIMQVIYTKSYGINFPTCQNVLFPTHKSYQAASQ